MSATADDSPRRAQQHAGLQDLFSYPLDVGAAGPPHAPRGAGRVAQARRAAATRAPTSPSPLTPLEEAILIASTSVTGAVMHDGPTQKPDGSPELGTMFLEVAGRAASSADNAQATSFFMINDEGVWLIKRPRGREALELFTRDPAALGGPHRGRLAVVRQRGQAQGLRRALRASRAAVAVLPRLERPALQRAGHDAASCRWSTTRASTSTCC